MKKLVYAGAAIAGACLSMILVTPGRTLAQQQQDSRHARPGGYDEVIIMRRGNDSTGHVTVEMNGSQVLVNGQKLEDYKGGGIRVIRRRIRPGYGHAYAFRNGRPGGYGFYGRGGFGRPGGYAFHRPMHFGGASLGARTQPADTKGAKIASVASGSAADKAGLKQGDIITQIGSRAVTGPFDVMRTIGRHHAGDTVNVTYLRDGQSASASIILDKSAHHSFHGAPMMMRNRMAMGGMYGGRQGFGYMHRPMPPMAASRFHHRWGHHRPHHRPRLGMMVAAAGQGNSQQGVKVLRVFPHSAAAQAGVEPEDLITEFAGKTVNSLDDVRKALQASKDSKDLQVKVVRKGTAHTLNIAMAHPGSTHPMVL